MKSMIVSALLLVASFAHADGFECVSPVYDLNIKIYNQTNPAAGTRNAAAMLISDQNVQFGRKMVARFDADAGTLTSKDLTYLAKVDLRFNDLSRKGENLLGTKLGELKGLRVVLGFTYANPIPHGAPLRGALQWVKRNGEIGSTDLLCRRYLKN